MTRILAILDRAEAVLIALLAGTALVLACIAMAGRYVLPALRLDWTFEVTIFAVIWATFIAGARIAGRGEHVRVDSFVLLLPQRARLALSVLATLAGIAMAGFLVWSGSIVVEESIRWNERTTSSLRLPLWVFYLSLPVGAALIGFHLMVRAVRLVTGRATDEVGHHER